LPLGQINVSCLQNKNKEDIFFSQFVNGGVVNINYNDNNVVNNHGKERVKKRPDGFLLDILVLTKKSLFAIIKICYEKTYG
jgi:hypothetical protein